MVGLVLHISRIKTQPRALYAATTALATKLGRNHYDNMCDKIDKCKDKDLVALWQEHVDHIGVGSTTKKAHMPWVIIKHKKRAGGMYRLLFSVQKRLFATRGETDYETSNNSQKK